MNTDANSYCVNMVEVGRRIQVLRTTKKIPMDRMQRFFGISKQALYKWERGESLPELQNLVALSRFLGVTVDHLLVGDDYPLAA